MATRQYIGARYVIKVYENSQNPNSAEWEANTAYEPLTMVTYHNDSYLSKKEVPSTVGNPANNPSYWVITGAYNGQIAALNTKVENLEEIIPTVENYAVDNKAINSSVVPVNLTFKNVSTECPNFRDELIVDEWRPFSDISKELTLRSIGNNTNTVITGLRNGIKIAPNGIGTAVFLCGGIFNPEINQCVHFKVHGNKGNTQYCRTGINFHTNLYIYFNNAEKKVYWESGANSWSPTALSNTTYDADVIEMWIFVQDKSAAVYISADGGAIEYVGTATSTATLFGNMGLFVRMPSGISAYAKVWDLKLVYTYNAFADPKYIHYEDTTPMILNDKAYLTADLQAENCNFVGILRHTLGQNDLELVGIVTSNYSNYSLALDMCFDRAEKRFIVLARVSTNNGTGVAYAFIHNNSLSGQIPLNLTLLPHVSNEANFGNYSNDEDGAICFFDGHWYFAINRIVGTDYYYNVYKSDTDELDLTSFTRCASIHSTSLTGGCFLAVGNTLYLLAGNGDAITCFNAVTGANAGPLLSNAPYRIWGNLTALTKGNKTKFYLTTFDRTKYATSNWSYGSVLMYESTDELTELIMPNTYGLK